MNYYQHHIGDFIKATACLDDSQTLRYLRLIWLYYDDEQPLPDNPRVLALKVGGTADEVMLLLEAFFVKDGDAWRHSRCDEELREYNAIRERNRANGKRKASQADSDSEASGKPVATQSKPYGEPNHKPVTNISTTDVVDIKAPAKPARFDAMAHLVAHGVQEQVAKDWLALRKAKRATPTETAIAGIAREARKAGIDLHQALAYCCERGWQGFKAEWVSGGMQDRLQPQGLGKFDPTRYVNDPDYAAAWDRQKNGQQSNGGGHGIVIDGHAQRMA